MKGQVLIVSDYGFLLHPTVHAFLAAHPGIEIVSAPAEATRVEPAANLAVSCMKVRREMPPKPAGWKSPWFEPKRRR